MKLVIRDSKGKYRQFGWFNDDENIMPSNGEYVMEFSRKQSYSLMQYIKKHPCMKGYKPITRWV